MAKKDISFEQALQRLEEIADSLENGDFSLEESIKLYEEGVNLIKLCNSKLEGVESSIKILINNDGELTEEDFNPNEK
ncbi:MAG: exodeoxyribonuclease VII small subunit [Clostridia bacterium]|nr:exodeoxyribonuclease VII small subunit [Clostridia bacterium]